MTIKNKKIPLCLFLTLALSACGDRESADTYLAQANTYLKESEYKESIIALKNAVKLAPDNGEIRFLLGQTYLALGSSLDAVKELEKAQSLNFKSNKLLPSLARAYLIANDDESILALKGAEHLPDESKVEFLAYKTLAAFRTQQGELAEETAQLAVDLLPANVFSILSQAYVELIHNNVEKAEVLVAKINRIESQNPEVIMLEAQIATTQQNHTKASELYQRYEVLQPNSRIVYLLIADSLLKANKYDEAEKYADAILTMLPNQPIANYVKASTRFVANDFESAVKFAEKAIQGNLNTPQLHLIAGAGSYHLGNIENAHNHLSIIADILVPEHSAKKMLIISQFQLGLIDDVTDSLDAFSPQSKADEQFLSALSFNLYSVGATQEARRLVDKSATTTDGTPTSNVRQGILKLLMNDPSGVENLELALEENPNLKGAELAIAYAALQSGDLDKAFTVAKKWQTKNPENAGSYNMLAAVYLAQQKSELAVQALQSSLLKEADNLFALTELAKLNFNDGKKTEAVQFAQRAVNKYPDNPKALRYYYAIKPDEQSLAKIKLAYQTSSNNIALALLYIDALMNAGDFTQALATSSSIDTSVKTPKKVWLQRLAIYKKQKNELQLISTIEKWLQANPYHIEPVLLASDHYVKQKQADKALQYIDKALLGHHTESLVLKIVKIQLLLDVAKVNDAKKLYKDQQFETITPELKSGIEGRIALLEKDFVTAAKKLAPFYQVFPTRQNAILLSLAYKSSNQDVQAEKVLQDHLLKNEQDDRVRMMLANNYIATDTAKAIIEYEKLVKTQSKNIVVLNNLAWLAMENGQLDKALEYAETAYKLAPEVANVADTYGQILLKLDNKKAALEKSKEAFELSKGQDADMLLNYAEVLIANAQKGNAYKILAKLEVSSSTLLERKNKLIELTEK